MQTHSKRRLHELLVDAVDSAGCDTNHTYTSRAASGALVGACDVRANARNSKASLQTSPWAKRDASWEALPKVQCRLS